MKPRNSNSTLTPSSFFIFEKKKAFPVPNLFFFRL